jgi:hypothetical protein
VTYDAWKTRSPDDDFGDNPRDDSPSELDLVYEQTRQLRDLVQTLLDNDPNEPIADNGMTVLDGWRERARQVLGAPAVTAGCAEPSPTNRRSAECLSSIRDGRSRALNG